MSTFNDLLSEPLPSQRAKNVEDLLATIESELGFDDGTEMTESFDDIDSAAGTDPVSAEEDADDDSIPTDGEGEATEIGDVGSDDIEDIADSEGELDPDDLDDDELRALDGELGGGAGDDGEEEHLSPEEEIQADDMMSVAATSLLVNDELSGDEKREFCEDPVETGIVVREGFMTEADINSLAAECGLVTEAKYTNKMIIRLDAESKKKQLYALAVNVSAAAHNDPDYYKLKKVMRMRKVLRARLDRKYHGEATKRMKVYFARLRKSKSTTMQKIAK